MNGSRSPKKCRKKYGKKELRAVAVDKVYLTYFQKEAILSARFFRPRAFTVKGIFTVKWKLFLVFGMLMGVGAFVYPLYQNRQGTVIIPLVSDGVHLAHGEVIIADEETKKIIPPSHTKEDASPKYWWGRPLIFGHWVKKQENLTITLLPGKYIAAFGTGEFCVESECVRSAGVVRAWSAFTVYPGQETVLRFNEEEVKAQAVEAFEAEVRWYDEDTERQQEQEEESPYIFVLGLGLAECVNNACAANEACMDIMDTETCVKRCGGEYTGPCVEGRCKQIAPKPPYDVAVCETDSLFEQ
jgi:hypothetical protein